MTGYACETVKSIEIGFSPEPETSFGGLSLVERLALRCGLWRSLEQGLGSRRGSYDWLSIAKSAIAGFLIGSRGTAVCQKVREDEALRRLLGVASSPEEATFWRALEELGQDSAQSSVGAIQRLWAKRLLAGTKRTDLFWNGFVPLFGDGTLLEGSARREGTLYIREKGEGLMWSTWFVGPFVAAQTLAESGQGEASCLRASLGGVLADVLDPLKLREKTLVLMDSLHGNGPTCSQLEREGLHYVVGANALAESDKTLATRQAGEWSDRGARPRLGWAESAVCVCSIQCAAWDQARTLVGRRWRGEGDLPGVYHYAGVMTNLTPDDVAHLCPGRSTYADAIWRLYDGKAGLEDQYKDLLEDLSGHYPPCQELKRNRGYYALLTLAHTLARGVDLLSGDSRERGQTQRRDGCPRVRPTPKRIRLWRLRLEWFALPARIARHARKAIVTLKGLGETMRQDIEQRFARLARC